MPPHESIIQKVTTMERHGGKGRSIRVLLAWRGNLGSGWQSMEFLSIATAGDIGAAGTTRASGLSIISPRCPPVVEVVLDVRGLN
jgi:hypothetical protein